jgi:hypothetical protein
MGFSEVTGGRALSYSNLSMEEAADSASAEKGYGCLFFTSELEGTL